MSGIKIIFIAVVIAVVIGGCGLGIMLRFRALCRKPGAVIMSLAQCVDGARGRWRLGVARLGVSELRWFSARSLGWWPVRSWRRDRLDIISREPSQLAGGVRASIVKCSDGSGEFELMMSDRAYAGFASWHESSPPRDYTQVV